VKGIGGGLWCHASSRFQAHRFSNLEKEAWIDLQEYIQKYIIVYIYKIESFWRLIGFVRKLDMLGDGSNRPRSRKSRLSSITGGIYVGAENWSEHGPPKKGTAKSPSGWSWRIYLVHFER
jgi:hypothetical protein